MMEYQTKIHNSHHFKTSFSTYVLGGDTGGTNTNLAVAGIQNHKPIILFSHRYKTRELSSLTQPIKIILDYAKSHYEISISDAVIGAAGVVSPEHDSAELTNASWNIHTKELLDHTPLSSAYLINDYQALGYGINLLNLKDSNDVLPIRKQKHHPSKSRIAVLGAGTGLGKTLLIYDPFYKAYTPLPSEGGHGDLPVQTEQERHLIEYLKKGRNITHPLSYEEVLSGRGIEGIYSFLRNKKNFPTTAYTKEIDGVSDKTSLISKYKNADETCKETFRQFTRFYGRCAKNFVLDTLATGGLYIAGGIAVKNPDIFSTREFLDEFENAYQRSALLKTISIYVIVNYDVSIYGACFAAMRLHKNNAIK